MNTATITALWVSLWAASQRSNDHILPQKQKYERLRPCLSYEVDFTVNTSTVMGGPDRCDAIPAILEYAKKHPNSRIGKIYAPKKKRVKK